MSAVCVSDAGRSEKTPTNAVTRFDQKTGIHIAEALLLQLDVQRRLHEQMEVFFSFSIFLHLFSVLSNTDMISHFRLLLFRYREIYSPGLKNKGGSSNRC
ncbi:hypothetical protein OIU84_025755 [Salix udensis]|uniref:MYB-CC type transcription factor LHEQLE-containing domain-containing protein n=1 Tax=Salix udensis TaxID=889485 RepID=A0AAD6KKC1_9ROSI|nr:hypothetical protein OIU84_025755 [Salix udensis]